MSVSNDPEVVYVNPDGTVNDEDEGQDTKGRGRVTIIDDDDKPDWPEELLAEARKYLDDEFIEAGGDYRENQYGAIYWLDLPHLVEFEKADERIESNKEFWEWFKDYREKHKIFSGRKFTPPKRDLFKYEYKDKWSYSSGGGSSYMSGWWKGWGLSASSEDTRRLATALGVIQSIVSVINNTTKRARVQLATEDEPEAPRSYTNIGEDYVQVVVSPQALLDKKIAEDLAIEVTAGWGLHEASHVEYTPDVISALRHPSQLKPLTLSSHLLNLLEDVRIEAMTADEFPGFRDYFAKANKYLWELTSKAAPQQWGPELLDKMNTITATVKWPSEYEQIVQQAGDQKLTEEFEWFRNWATQYDGPNGAKSPRQLLIEALDHLKEDEDTKQQMQDMSDGEATDDSTRLTDEEFGRLMDGLRQELGSGAIQPCPTPHGIGNGPSVTLTYEQAQEIDQLIKQELKDYTAMPVDTSGSHPEDRKVVILRPQEDSQSRALYKRPGPLLAKLKAAFVFRKKAPEWSEQMLRSGDLDENNLWRIAGHDLRVFERKVTTTTPNTQVTLLIDMSSSMFAPMGGGYSYGYGPSADSRIATAQFLATTMLECLRTMKGVTVRVRGHMQGEYGATIYRLWEQGDPYSRLGLASALCDGGTPDGFALDWCSRELLDNHRPGEDMVLIILSDGMPNSSLPGISGHEHVRRVVQHYKKQGVTTISIGMAAGFESYQQLMYEHWIGYESESKLPMQLTRLLIKLFGGVSQ